MKTVSETLILEGCKMSRRSVIQIACDRCNRVEVVPVTDDLSDEADLDATFLGHHIVYGDLCTKCKETLGKHWDSISKITKSPQKVTRSVPSAPVVKKK